MGITERYAALVQEVKIYRDAINEVEFPDEMEKLLDEYLKNPSTELQEIIESQYSVETIKKAAFAAGCIYTEMNTTEGKIKRFFYRHKLEWLLKPIAIILVTVLLFSVYHIFFRYKYRTYKDNWGRVQVIKVDKLTGKSILYYPVYVENTKTSKSIWDDAIEVKEKAGYFNQFEEVK